MGEKSEAGNTREYFTFEQGMLKINQEHNLIHYRMQWMLASQAFLIAAYCFLDFSQTATLDVTAKPFAEYLLIISGLITSVVSTCSIFAAFVAIRVWRNRMSEADRKNSVSDLPIHFFGDLPPAITPPLAGSLWVGLLVYDLQNFQGISLSFMSFPIIIAFLAALLWFFFVAAIFYRIEKT